MFREKEMAHWFYLTVLMNHMEEKMAGGTAWTGI